LGSVDLVEELRAKNQTVLEGIERKQIAEVYLFFDYDGHATNASDQTIEEMLNYFNDETENGKLFISYPMVEAIKHLKADIDFQNTIVDAKNNIRYKKLVNRECDRCYTYSLQLSHWHIIIQEHCNKLNFLMSESYSFPTQLFEQIEVFNMQFKKYIKPENKVAVLSAFPVLLLDYYGAKGLHNKIYPQLTTQQESI
jgi:hypothetical protein